MWEGGTTLRHTPMPYQACARPSMRTTKHAHDGPNAALSPTPPPVVRLRLRCRIDCSCASLTCCISVCAASMAAAYCLPVRAHHRALSEELLEKNSLQTIQKRAANICLFKTEFQFRFLCFQNRAAIDRFSHSDSTRSDSRKRRGTQEEPRGAPSLRAHHAPHVPPELAAVVPALDRRSGYMLTPELEQLPPVLLDLGLEPRS